MASMHTTLHLSDQATVAVHKVDDAEWVQFEEDNQGVSFHVPLDVQRALAGAWLNAIDEAERDEAEADEQNDALRHSHDHPRLGDQGG